MTELFDYGGFEPDASVEVAAYGLDQDLLATDWRQRASDHFRQVERGARGHYYGSAIGALSLAISSEKTAKSQTAEIQHWEERLLLKHDGPDD